MSVMFINLDLSKKINCYKLDFYRVLCICGDLTHLATGSFDRTINIWLLKDGKLCQTLVGHTKGVWAVKFLSTILLMSGAYDATIKVRNEIEDYTMKRIFETILALEYQYGSLFTNTLIT